MASVATAWLSTEMQARGSFILHIHPEARVSPRAELEIWMLFQHSCYHVPDPAASLLSTIYGKQTSAILSEAEIKTTLWGKE